MSLSELEAEIIAEGKRIEAVGREEVLKLRKSAIVKELEKIETELSDLLGKVVPAKAPVAEAVPEPKEVAAKRAAAEAEPKAASKS